MPMPTKLLPRQMIEVEGHLYAYKWNYSEVFHIQWGASKPDAGPDTIYIAPYTLAYRLPEDFNEIKVRLEGIEAAKNALYAAFRQQDEELTEKKEKLLALTYQPTISPQEPMEDFPAETSDYANVPPIGHVILGIVPPTDHVIPGIV
jgi:hypothetical protein